MSSKSAHFLVLAVIFLVTLGVVMLFSTSAFSNERAGDIYYDVKRQFAWMGLASLVCVVLAVMDYHWLQRGAMLWYVLAAVLLTCCFLPMVGENINGASRWVSLKAAGLRGLRFQPSEMAKMAAIIFVAAWYAKRSEEEAGTFIEGFLKPLAMIGLLVVLIGAEVDLGTAALLCAVSLGMMFAAGASMRWLAATGGFSLLALAALVVAIPNRFERLMAFLHLEERKADFGLQQWRALLALGSGGVSGLGLGSGRQKMLYLPFAHTDFIFPMVGEELGLPFTLLIVFFFMVILVSGCVIALHAPDRFGRLLALGIVMMITLQAILNIGVTTAVLPNKGLPLPFVSYGGSNLLCCFAGIGILLNIYRQGLHVRDDRFPKIMRAKVTPRL